MLNSLPVISTIARLVRAVTARSDPGRVAAILLVTIGFGTCFAPAAVGGATPQDAPVASLEAIDDGDITAAVERELNIDARVMRTDISDIEVVTTEGVVTLSGTTDNILTRERATRIAESIRGVRSVVNRIKVERSNRSDVEVLNGVVDALADDPATEAWELTIEVSNGVVTLEGTVDSWQKKQLAGSVAKSVEGVTGLNNEITVGGIAMRPEAEIKEDVENALRWDVRIDDGLINVSVENGVVRLTGSVGSAVERTLALNDAYVTGVSDVEAGDLEVRWWARDDMKRVKWAASRSDDEVEEAVADALFYDPRVAAFDITVTMDDGLAILSGTVNNLKAKQAAAQDARNTVGVRAVENNLIVKPKTYLTDASVAQTIRERLALDPYVDRHEISVEVEDGTAILTGDVDTYFESWQARDIASRVSGVKVVDNNLRVGYPAAPQEPLIESWDPVAYDVDYFPPHPMADSEVQNSIERELWWSPYVDETFITVTVDDGIARLTGSVNSFEEQAVATQEALEGGAIAVENELVVDTNPL